jgi:hypothetical protein
MGGIFLTLAVILVFSGCTETEVPEPEKGDSASNKVVVDQEKSLETPEEIVGNRAGSRWDAIIKNNYEAVYGYLAPGVRSMTTMPQFTKNAHRGPITWNKVEVKAVSCEEGGEVCEVTGTLDYTYNGLVREAAGQQMTTAINEKWVLVDGDWWFYPD